MISLGRRAHAAPIGHLAHGFGRLAPLPAQRFDPGPSPHSFRKEHTTDEPIEG